EETLVEAVKVFELVDELVRWRRECVFHGVEEPNPQLDEEEKALYTDWLALVEDGMPRLETLEKYGIVEGADWQRATRERARSFLARWRPAALSTAVGLRVLEFSEEDADQIYALLNSPKGAPGRPTRPPRSVPRGDPSSLR